MSKVIVQILRAPIGGIRKHVFDIIEHLSDKDVTQVFVTNVQDSDRVIPHYPNLIILDYPIVDKPQVQDLFNIGELFLELRKLNVDVIHGHGAKGGLYARILSFILKCFCLYTPHGGSLHRVFGKLKNKIYDFIELSLVPLTDTFLFESLYSQTVFNQNITDVTYKSVVNYNGVEIQERIKGTQYQPNQKMNLASFGLLRNLKGHDIFIKACSLIHKKNIPFHYTIFGNGEELNNLQKLVMSYGLNSFVTIQDYCEDTLAEMKKFDFIVHPSRFESFGYVPAEAMSLGIPVISSHEGGLKEVVDDKCGFVSIDNSPESYARVLEQLFNGEVSIDDKIENGIQKVSALFSKEKMLMKIESLYKI